MTTDNGDRYRAAFRAAGLRAIPIQPVPMDGDCQGDFTAQGKPTGACTACARIGPNGKFKPRVSRPNGVWHCDDWAALDAGHDATLTPQVGGAHP